MHYYAMQYIDGESLARIIEQLTQLKPEESGKVQPHAKTPLPAEGRDEVKQEEADPSSNPKRLAELGRSLVSERFASTELLCKWFWQR